MPKFGNPISTTRYWVKSFALACKDTGTASWIRGVGGAVLSFIGQMVFLGIIPSEVNIKTVLIAIGSGACVFIIEFLWRAFVLSPAKLHNEIKNSLDLAEANVEALRKEKDQKARLEIELEDGMHEWNGSESDTCRVRVRNISQSSTADDVELSLIEITPKPGNPLRPLPYELGKSGTNCVVKKVQLHAGMPATFDLFRFYTFSEVKFRQFQIQDIPQTSGVMNIPMLTLTSQEGETKEWQFELRASGLHLETVTQRFKLVAEARSLPKLSKI
jgi:hypothetical protein